MCIGLQIVCALYQKVDLVPHEDFFSAIVAQASLKMVFKELLRFTGVPF